MKKVIKQLQSGGVVFYMFITRTFAFSLVGIAMYIVIKVLDI